VTAPVIDRNEAFAAERASQIAAIQNFNSTIPDRAAAAREAADKYRADFAQRVADGKVRDNGNGTYTVTDPGSWDNGETLRMRTPRGFELEQPMALPESNLDETTGKVALYSMQDEWHGLGNIVPEGVSDLDEVLRLGGIDFEVVQVPTLYTNPVTGKVEEVPGTFTTARADTGAALSKNGQSVGKVYRAIQNRQMGAFLQDLVVRYDVRFLSAGATYGGSHVFIGMKLPEDIVLDLGDGVEDIIEPKLYFLGNHDGTARNTITVAPWRVACGNTERFSMRDAVAKWGVSHTTNAMSDANVKEARRTLGLTVKYFTEFKGEEEALARTNLAIAEFEAVIGDLWEKPAKDASKRAQDNWSERTGTLVDMWGEQVSSTGKTAYSAERVFTDWTDHVAFTGRGKAARATALIEGTDDQLKNKVHKRLMQTVK
jgi:phage/plasmid-like protein (TIGR03299 family)